jgi:hypothetical protein
VDVIYHCLGLMLLDILIAVPRGVPLPRRIIRCDIASGLDDRQAIRKRGRPSYSQEPQKCGSVLLTTRKIK